MSFFIDFLGCFVIFGYILAYFFGGLTEEGFNLEGISTLFLFSLIVSYFIIMKRYFGGTFGKKIFGIVSSKHHK
jgi:uncharacterized RDD family membrane protein YckC